MKLKIGFSYAPADVPKFRRYHDAVQRAGVVLEHEIETVDLSSGNVPDDLDAIVFTGGADIQPSRYGKQDEERLCTDIDEARDQREFELADRAEEQGMPVLGICRGLQLLNVHRGGTLLTDIETFGGGNHKKASPDHDRRHHVKVTPTSYLGRIMGRQWEGEINSAHHQGIERIGDGLTVSARATDDGTAEAIEWADPQGKPFLLAVQWHPERMEYDERFAGRIFEAFVWEVAAHKMLRDRIGVLRAPRESDIPPEEGSYDATYPAGEQAPENPVISQNGHAKRPG